jgi:hypothetical protein
MPDLGTTLSCSLDFAIWVAFVVFPKSASAGIAKTSVLRTKIANRYIDNRSKREKRLLLGRVDRAKTPPMALDRALVLTFP